MFFTGANPGWSYSLYTTGVAVMAHGHPRVVYTGDFNPAAWMDVLPTERVTYTGTAPSAYRQLAHMPPGTACRRRSGA